jgi:hypothetical protein
VLEGWGEGLHLIYKPEPLTRIAPQFDLSRKGRGEERESRLLFAALA